MFECEDEADSDKSKDTDEPTDDELTEEDILFIDDSSIDQPDSFNYNQVSMLMDQNQS